MFLQRTHHCGELRATHEGQTIILNGWVNTIRNQGGLLFIDVRDSYGKTQVLHQPESNPNLHEQAEKLRHEDVIAIKGIVRLRAQANRNPKLPTGDVEIELKELEVLNTSAVLPFQINSHDDVNEAVRLEHRYLDLRGDRMQNNLRARAKIMQAIRSACWDMGFTEIETPILYKSTPEGAKEYLVPSRVHPGKVYALPQSPQVFKQILVTSGFDKYFQIARCFRDEDLRANRQPEFTQLDMEMGFVRDEDILKSVETIVRRIFREVKGLELPEKFPRMTWDEAMARFASDKPDTRFGLEMTDISTLVANSEFGVFRGCVEGGGIVKGFVAPGAGESFPRKKIDALVKFVGEHGAKGLAWFKVENGGLSSGISKFFKPEEQTAIIQTMKAKDGDLLLYVADKAKVVNTALNALRNHLGKDMNLYDPTSYSLLWVVDFPQFEFSEEDNRWVTAHHPFTRPKNPEHLDGDLGAVRAQAYDLVLNGEELGGGSIRIHEKSLQAKVFGILGLTEESAKQKFGFLLEALSYGAPPHGGIALGLDRFVMLLQGEDNIREVIAFPKTQKASCLLTGAPTEAAPEQLKDLGLQCLPLRENKL